MYSTKKQKRLLLTNINIKHTPAGAVHKVQHLLFILKNVQNGAEKLISVVTIHSYAVHSN